jgi:GNAT superfamily N-acetyltransferase
VRLKIAQAIRFVGVRVSPVVLAGQFAIAEQKVKYNMRNNAAGRWAAAGAEVAALTDSVHMEAQLSLTEQDMLYAVESGICIPAVPHKLEALTIPGVTGHFSQRRVEGSTTGVINRVGRTRLTTENADATIKAIRTHFTARNQRFIWIVTEELSTPPDLTARLENAGFTRRFEMAGMSLTELTRPITLNPAVRVQRANASDNEKVSKLYQHAFPLDQDVADIFVDLIDALAGAHYLAYFENVDEPIGVASMFYTPDPSVAVLEAAATLEAYRGQGVYRSLLARRLADAQADAMQLAVIHAIRTTSQPVLSKLGFVERCNMIIYVWDPAEAA